MIGRWWHRKILNHNMKVNRTISVPSWDPSAKGILYKCSCGRMWAL